MCLCGIGPHARNTCPTQGVSMEFLPKPSRLMICLSGIDTVSVFAFRYTPSLGDMTQFVGKGGSRTHRTAALNRKACDLSTKRKEKNVEHSSRFLHGLFFVAQTSLFEAIGLPVVLSVHLEHLLSVFKVLFHLSISFIPSLVSYPVFLSNQLMWVASLAILRQSCWCVGTRLELISPSSVAMPP